MAGKCALGLVFTDPDCVTKDKITAPSVQEAEVGGGRAGCRCAGGVCLSQGKHPRR